MRRIGSRLVLECTGREFYAHDGILGLCEDGDGVLRATHGYDGDVEPDEFDHGRMLPRREDAFTAEERREVANSMVGLWLAWQGQDPAKRNAEAVCERPDAAVYALARLLSDPQPQGLPEYFAISLAKLRAACGISGGVTHNEAASAVRRNVFRMER